MSMNNEVWQSGITDIADGTIHLRGYEITELMQKADFAEVVFLLHKARMPSKNEKHLLNALLIASADHGPKSPSAAAARMVTSGNRVAFEASVAAGVLAIGDAHGGAGQACMEMIKRGLATMRDQSLTLNEAAKLEVSRHIEESTRIPGIGHRVHSKDPRAELLLSLATKGDISKEGSQFLKSIERAVAKKIRPMPINVDGAMAAVLFDMGFESTLAKAFFILGRVAGITAHIQEELTREKTMRFKPEVGYDGPSKKSLDS